MTSRRRHWRTAALVIGVALVLAACGSDSKKTSTSTGASSGGTKTSYSIAFVGPLTGANANLGINPRDGALVAVKEANDAGGDITFDLKQFDTQGDPAQAPTVKDKYINDSAVLGVVGPVFSGETKAVLQAYEDAKLVMVSPSATGVVLSTVVANSQSFHRIVPDDDVQAKGVTDYVTKKLKPKSVFYIHDNQEYGKGLAEGTQKSLEAAGVKTAGTPDAIDPNSQDYSATVNKAVAAKPDLVYYGGYYSQAGRLAKQLKDGGLEAVFMSGDGVLDPGFIQAGGSGTEGAQLTCACKLASSDAAGDLGTFAKKYKEVIGKDPGTYSTEGYDATKLLIEGIKKGNTTREKLRDYVNTFKTSTYTGAGKDISFEANGNVKATGVFVYEVKSGKLSVLGTTDELAK